MNSFVGRAAVVDGLIAFPFASLGIGRSGVPFTIAALLSGPARDRSTTIFTSGTLYGSLLRSDADLIILKTGVRPSFISMTFVR